MASASNPGVGKMSSPYGTIPSESNGSMSLSMLSETTPLISNTTGLPHVDFDGVDEPSFLSKLVFHWFTPILKKGNEKKRLDPEDLELIPLPDFCCTEKVSGEFEKCWEAEKLKPNPSLLRAFYLAFGSDFIRAGFLKLIHDLCVFVGPQVLHSMIVFLRDPNSPLWHGIVLTVAVTLSQLTMSLCLRHYFYKCYNVGLRVRTAVVMVVYRKALLLSAAERQARTLGEITNLSSIDAERLQSLTGYLHALWYSPVQIGLALYFLYQQLGLSSFGGVAVIIIITPATKYIAQFMGYRQRILMKAKDRRVELNSEVLANMKVVKMQAWEGPFKQRILDLRSKELRQLFLYSAASSLSNFLWSFTPVCVSLATFTAYVWSGHQLDVASALTALALFDVLRFPLALFPQVINDTVEAVVSMNRIRSFLLSDEYKPISSKGLDHMGVKMDNVSAAYDSKKPKLSESDSHSSSQNVVDKDWEVALLEAQLQDAEERVRVLTGRTSSDIDEGGLSSLLCLKRIDFECNPGELVAVVGGVGSGKSSFLNAILGEVREVAGSTSVKGKLAYFSQSPFIMNATLRDNILFGHVSEPIDEDLYERALDCCALRHDLELLPHGDDTEIGEKGVTLSGGQKARVALARAVYHCADVTLIDDALSAVDAHVAAHLFEHAIVGELLKPKEDGSLRSVVMSINAIQFLKHGRVSQIVVLEDGRIAEKGPYSQLSSDKESTFARFLAAVEDAVTGAQAGLVEEEGPLGGLGNVSPKSSVRSVSDSCRVSGGEQEPPTSKKRLMTEESRLTGHVSANVYKAWASAAGGWWVPVVIVLAFVMGESLQVLSNWFITYWSGHGDATNQIQFLEMYALINVASALLGTIRMLIVAVFGILASRQLFGRMLSVVLHAPMSFFDTTPVGRLVNRFGKDIYTVDEELTSTLQVYLLVLFEVVSTVVVISCVTPFFTVCLIPIILYYLWEQSYFTVAYRELKRLDSVSRSPIYALLGESVDGVAVIRSFGAERSLMRRLMKMLDVQQHAYFLTCAAQSWLAVRLELTGTLIITFACLSAVLERSTSGADPTFAGLAGLAISYALNVTQSLNWSVRMASDMEANMIAVERVQEYTQLESEGDLNKATDDKLPLGWPQRGEIQMKGVSLRYRPGLPLVLKGLNVLIPAGSKVGVVGRTGAGKSTLMVALMRIVELVRGEILIDGTDTSTVGIEKLRRNIAVIPQDPTLFSGTVRSNLDPFDNYSDDDLYRSLERVNLYSPLNSSRHSASSHNFLCRIESLEDEVAEGGVNFSVGQRQLLVIARALLRESRIIIMDEATASVDAETDAMIQQVMRLEFANATVITVAHRINTIMDSDYILGMADGMAAEFDKPDRLLKKGGLFRDLVMAASRH